MRAFSIPQSTLGQAREVLALDHYASLGVSRTSEDVVIRAAYLALMRRYHPDGNPSPDATERVRAITTAYGVLGDEAKRREYDRGWDVHPSNEVLPAHKKVPAGPFAFGVTTVCMGLLIWTISVQKPSQTSSQVTHPRSDNASSARDQVSCLSAETKDLLRQELVRKAANLRRGDGRSFAAWAATMSMRTSPALTISELKPGVVECSGSVSLALPPVAAMKHGQSALSGNVDFSLTGDPGKGAKAIEIDPDNRFLIELASARLSPDVGSNNSIISAKAAPPLRERWANVRPQTSKASGRPYSEIELALTSGTSSKERRLQGNELSRILTAPRAVRDLARTGKTDPCNDLRRSGRQICVREDLTALEQQVALFERQSFANSVGGKRMRLELERNRFNARRKSCTTEACTRKLLLSRTTDIADIMQSRSTAAPR